MSKGRSKAEKPRRRTTPRVRATSDDMRPEYDFSDGVRGKYAHLFGANRSVRVVVLAPDVAKEFRSARAVNAALRRLMKGRKRNGVPR